MGEVVNGCTFLGGFALFYLVCMIVAVMGSCWLISVYAPAFFVSMTAGFIFGIYFIANALFWLVLLPLCGHLANKL